MDQPPLKIIPVSYTHLDVYKRQVAVVDQGWVTPVGVGETQITVTLVESGLTASCVVKVVSAIIPYEGPVFYGDVDGNAEVDAADAVIILRYLVGLADLDPDQLEAADVYDDSEVNCLLYTSRCV